MSGWQPVYIRRRPTRSTGVGRVCVEQCIQLLRTSFSRPRQLYATLRNSAGLASVLHHASSRRAFVSPRLFWLTLLSNDCHNSLKISLLLPERWAPPWYHAPELWSPVAQRTQHADGTVKSTRGARGPLFHRPRQTDPAKRAREGAGGRTRHCMERRLLVWMANNGSAAPAGCAR